jgi:hypothetical protein
VIKLYVEEVTSREAKSTFEEREKHHNLDRIGCRNIFASSGTPLQHGGIKEKVIRNKFLNLTFICDG